MSPIEVKVPSTITPCGFRRRLGEPGGELHRDRAAERVTEDVARPTRAVLGEPAPGRARHPRPRRLGRQLVGAVAEAAVVDREHREAELALSARPGRCCGRRRAGRRAGTAAAARASAWPCPERMQADRPAGGRRVVLDPDALHAAARRPLLLDARQTGPGRPAAWKIHLRCCVSRLAQPTESAVAETAASAIQPRRRTRSWTRRADIGRFCRNRPGFQRSIYGFAVRWSRSPIERAEMMSRVHWGGQVPHRADHPKQPATRPR